MQKRSKFKKYYEGKISFNDLKNEKINKKYLEQIDFELNNREPKINKKELDKIDLLIIGRQTAKDEVILDLIEKAHGRGLKVLFDLDDL